MRSAARVPLERVLGACSKLGESRMETITVGPFEGLHPMAKGVSSCGS
jgi:hypothetical protein